ncbi:hypothetical protein BST61_g5203 [Cercospora zeina]
MFITTPDTTRHSKSLHSGRRSLHISNDQIRATVRALRSPSTSNERTQRPGARLLDAQDDERRLPRRQDQPQAHFDPIRGTQQQAPVSDARQAGGLDSVGCAETQLHDQPDIQMFRRFVASCLNSKMGNGLIELLTDQLAHILCEGFVGPSIGFSKSIAAGIVQVTNIILPINMLGR